MAVLTVRRWSTVQDFLSAARDFLAAREAEHCLLFGIAAVIAAHPEVYADPRFWTVHDADRVVGAALRTPPHNLVLSQFDDPRFVAALADDVLASDDLPGAMGPTGVVRQLADAWASHAGPTGRTPVRKVQERIHRLDRVVAPRPAPGQFREAAERDRAILSAWWDAFSIEAIPESPRGDPDEAADRMLRRIGRTAYIWDDADEPVAFACLSGPTPRGIRVGPVYTPPALRGRGYASNLVAACSTLALAEGRTFCFLFTDLANPTSNKIYQSIGYVPVIDIDLWLFPAAARA
jgi:predicted GNAT family acetyltransferase